ncbi:MAG: HEAT repeat domain-containing protein [Phycisphaeraceae bacterium]
MGVRIINPLIGRRPTGLMLRLGASVLCAGLSIASVTAPAAAAERPDTGRLTAEQQRDMDLLLGVLGDGKIDLAKRRAAAVNLLTRGWPAAMVALGGQLADASDPTGQRAVASALGAAEVTPPDALAEPLLALIGADNDALRRDVAAALGRYEDGPVLTRLIAWANDSDKPANVRLGAIAVLAEHRQPISAQTLVGLTEPKQDGLIRNAAFDALQELTGDTEIGRDAAGWHQWWEAHRQLPRDRWLARMVRSLSEQKRQLAADQATLTARLADALGQLYVATAEADRPALLMKMLDDPITAVRLEALALVERNLLNAQSPPQPVRDKLRTRLDDDSPTVRASAAALLRDIDDDPAADQVAGRLSAETDPAARNAYLSLLARKPRPAAIDPALVLLGRSDTRSAAAAMVIAALDAGLLQPRQQAAALKAARAAVRADASPDPAMVKLLGRMAQDEDRATIEGLLDGTDPAVRKAAAEAFVAGTLDVAPLMRRIDDPVLAGRALEAAARRGKTPAIAELLLNHPPSQKELTPTWRAALLAVAGRLDMPALRKLDDAMIAHKGATDLRAAMLKPVAGAKDVSPDRTELLLRLGRLLLEADQPAQAGTIYDLIGADGTGGTGATGGISDEQRARRDRGMLEAMLRTSPDDDAIALAGRVAQQDENGAALSRRLLLDAADTALTAKRTEQAGLLLAAVGKLTTAATSADQQSRLKSLRAKLAAAQQSAPTPGAAPAPGTPASSPTPTPATPAPTPPAKEPAASVGTSPG